jgi:hypothetical protein
LENYQRQIPWNVQTSDSEATDKKYESISYLMMSSDIQIEEIASTNGNPSKTSGSY